MGPRHPSLATAGDQVQRLGPSGQDRTIREPVVSLQDQPRDRGNSSQFTSRSRWFRPVSRRSKMLRSSKHSSLTRTRVLTFSLWSRYVFSFQFHLPDDSVEYASRAGSRHAAVTRTLARTRYTRCCAMVTAERIPRMIGISSEEPGP